MSEDLVPYEAQEHLQLGELRLANPAAVVGKATEIASALSNIIDSRKLYSVISQKKYVRVEGWSTLGAMLGVLPREVAVVEHDDGTFEATVELIRASNQAVIGRASAICGSDEPQWATRIRNARRSMAITRATGKAYRLGFSWIIQLAGYQPTPAEEMVATINSEAREVKPQTAKSKPKPSVKKARKPRAKAKPEAAQPASELDAMEWDEFYPMVTERWNISPRQARDTLDEATNSTTWGQDMTKTEVLAILEQHFQEEKDA